jgi:glucose/arabinose dehydrogenase
MRRFRMWIIPVLLLAGTLACLSNAATPSPATSGPVVASPQPNNVTAPTVPPADTPAGNTAAPTNLPASQPPAQSAQPDLTTVQIALKPLVDGFEQPVAFVSAKDHSGRMFVVSRMGKIFIVKDGQVQSDPFLDISGKVTTGYQEQGLLGLAFHPNYSQNGFFFIYYNDSNGNIAISRMSVSSNPDKADPNSEQIVLQYNKPAKNHNGGNLEFGPDGDLYLGTGDGGGAGDQFHNGQNPNSVLAKILRINVDTLPYTIPADNPFVNQAGFRPEIWAWGVRNPWRFSFDRQTGDLYIGEVGQNTYEEIDYQPAGKGGQNYGWSKMEGMHCYNAGQCASDGLTLPVAEYSHDEGCSVSGGYVYRGGQFPALNGIYFFADYCSGTIWGMTHAANGSWPVRNLLNAGSQVSSFGEDETGEVYVVDLGGRILQLVQAGG